MELSTKRSLRLDTGAGWLLVVIGLLHAILTRYPARHATLMLSAAMLMVVVGLSSLVSRLASRNERAARATLCVGTLASLAGIALALGLLWTDPLAPQGPSLLMVFGIAALFTRLRSAW